MNIIAQLMEHFKPTDAISAVILEPPTDIAHSIMEVYPNMERIASIDKMCKYAFYGTYSPEYDIAVLDGASPKTAWMLWGRLNIGGAVISSEKHHSVSGLFGQGHLVHSPWIFWKRQWVMVSGCNRGATHYISKVLNCAGIRVGHERYERDGAVCGRLSAVQYPANTRAIHQLRNPYRVIASLLALPRRMTTKYPNEVFTFEPGESRLHYFMRCWLWLDGLAKSRALWMYNVEDIELRWDEICDHLSIERCPLPFVSKTLGTGRSGKLIPIWEMMVAEDEALAYQIQERARGYGYQDEQ